MKLSLNAKHSTLFSNSFYIFAARFFPQLAYMLVLLYYSRFLDKPVYGTYQNFWVQVNILYPFVCFGIHILIVTYAPRFVLALASKIRRISYLLYGVWIVFISVIFARLQASPLSVSPLVPAAFLLVFAFNIISESAMIVFGNLKTLVGINLLYAIGYVALHWLVLKNGFSYQNIFLSLLVLNFVKLTVLVISIAVSARVNTSTTGASPSIAMSAIRNLWLHLGVFDILQMMSGMVDKFIVSLFFTAAISAVYFNGAQNIPFLPLIINAVSSAMLMQLASAAEQDEDKQIIRLLNSSAKMTANVVLPAFLFLLFFAYELFAVLLPRYQDSVPVFIISILILPLRAYGFSTVFQKKHKGAIVNIGAIGELAIAFALIYPLYQLLGLRGIALSFVISTYLQASFYLYQAAKLLGTSMWKILPWGNWLVKLIVFAVLFIAIHYLATRFFTAWVALTLGGVAAIAMAIVSLLVELKKERRYVITSPQR